MTTLNILHYPDARLHTIAAPVAQIDDTVLRLIDDMAETMYAAPGIGLAATQVDVHQRVVVIDISETRDALQVFINPKIIEANGTTVYTEGCLSVPGVFEEVERAETVTVEALGRDGKMFTLAADGLLAICIQHEIDHLNGKVFIEKLSQLKFGRIVTKIKKDLRRTM